VAVTVRSAGVRGVPHLLHNFKFFNLHGPQKTLLRLLTVKRYIIVTVEV
jgi:hypothetical protein